MSSTNWMKVQKTTPDKPEILLIANALDKPQAEAFLAFFRLWTYFDDHTEEGEMPFFGFPFLDKQAGLPGFAQACTEVGWLVVSGKTLYISNWDRHNSQSAKRRALDAERKAKARAKGRK